MLSVIVPVYNVVQYLRHCLQSLDQQGLDDIEIILVNDASRDNSRGICAEWCENHPSFRLINHDTNQGLSEARNTGLREAKGEYVTFVDSDDFLAPNTLAEVMTQFDDKVDAIEYPVMEHHLSKYPHLRTFEPKDVTFEQWLQINGCEHCYACNKVFRSRLWEGISFPRGKHFEDIYTIPFVLQKCRNIRQTDKGIYYYCERPGSICTTQAPQTLLDYTNAINQLLQLAESKNNNRMILRARNAERTYREATHSNTRIIHPRHTSLSFCFSSNLTMHDRLKVLYYAFF